MKCHFCNNEADGWIHNREVTNVCFVACYFCIEGYTELYNLDEE